MANMLRVAPLIAALLFARAAFAAGEIDACKYLMVTDFTEDPYGIAKELRTQARAKGFIVISNRSEASAADALKACVLIGSWSAGGFGGQLAVRIVDAVGGTLVAEARADATNWWGIERTVRGGVGKIFKQLKYAGYKEDVHQARIQRLYPSRPKIDLTEPELRERELKHSIEGIWTDVEDQYRLAIITAPPGTGADFVAVILRAALPIWQPGEIKAEIRSTASPEVFTATYFMLNKQSVGTTLVLERNALLKGSAKIKGPSGESDLTLMRVWPATGAGPAAASNGSAGVSGTGFLLTQTGLIATNWHVVADATNITVAFPEWSDGIAAQVVIRDATNDLAVLRVADVGRIRQTCADFPYRLMSSGGIALGEHVSTIGYPLQSLLGSNPKFSEGVVASKTGLLDDPRSLQVTAQVQPGSSGGPLFDSEGNVVGIVVATLDAAKLYAASGALPQNVNWAIKSDYLLNLLAMLPGESPAPRTMPFSPERAAKCVGVVWAR